MGQVRWAGWTVAIATTLIISSGPAGAQLKKDSAKSDEPAAIVVYPDIESDLSNGVDTVIRLTNTNPSKPLYAWCFYVDANQHCSGGVNDGSICTSDPGLCTGGTCTQGWQETDFRIKLTPLQPIQWLASEGLADNDLPIPTGRCKFNPRRSCGKDSDCQLFIPGDLCTQSNAGTRIPPVSEDPFQGELRCIATNELGDPVVSNNPTVAVNDMKGESLIETATTTNLDVASYNAIGMQSTGNSIGDSNVLTIGPGTEGEYKGCPNFLILNHFFDGAADPVPSSNPSEITTDLVLVPCTADYLRQVPGSATVQYLVFNEFEQRISASNKVDCFRKVQLCNIDTTQCERSAFNVAVMGTLTGQTRMLPQGSGLVGVAIEHHIDHEDRSAAFNLHMQGTRSNADTITVP